MDEISDLRLFTAIVSAGSLSEAARRTKGSLPGMSRRLAKLEARLGAKLIDRGSRHFVLTQEGRVLYERAQHIVAEIDDMETEIGRRASSPRGHLRIGAPHEIGRSRLASILADFGDANPQVSVELVLTDSKLEEAGQDFDLGLHIDMPAKSESMVRKLISSKRVLCAAPSYLDRCGSPRSVEDLARHRCIMLWRSRHAHDRWHYRDVDGVHEYAVEGSLATNCSDVMHAWALEGRGIAQKAKWDIEKDLTEGRLVRLLPDQFRMDLLLYVTYSSAEHLPARTRLAIDYIADAVTGRGAPSPPPPC